uniref:Uncharacterized protein n=1 Tax=Kwoniella dejecticola CBS 10117 TaxID=1296121 RepID=A0A1A6AEW8_9TREE|nr:uncharacterized protein I303_00411 [Kwoniella dejecticola CBS 10117]OBR88594.1 hypothetical protein I303_00411 [Kwoniella dejecticola CBS 10117]
MSNLGNTTSARSSLAGRTAWGGVDAEHPFEILSNPHEEPPIFILILTLILFGFFIVFNIPKMVIRLISNNNGGELFNGIKLSSKSPSPSPSVITGGIALAQTPITPKSRSRASTFVEGTGVVSPVYPSPIYQTPTTATPLRSFNTYPSPSSERLIRKVNPPRQFPSLTSILPGGSWLDATVPVVGYTIGQVFLCSLWAGLIALGLFYNNESVYN